MDGTSIDTALVGGIAAAGALLASLVGALVWVGPGRRARARRRVARALERELAEARAQRQRAIDDVVRVSRDYAALRDAVRADCEAAARAQRESLVEELAPLAASLEELVRGAPKDHPLVEGLALVHKQLVAISSAWGNRPPP